MENAVDEKAHSIWDGDCLNREGEARLLIDFLVARVAEREQEGRSGAYVLNIDSPWGTGKTFFLTRLAKQLSAEGYLVGQMNAWKDDGSDEPLISIVNTLKEVLQQT